MQNLTPIYTRDSWCQLGKRITTWQLTIDSTFKTANRRLPCSKTFPSQSPIVSSMNQPLVTIDVQHQTRFDDAQAHIDVPSLSRTSSAVLYLWCQIQILAEVLSFQQWFSSCQTIIFQRSVQPKFMLTMFSPKQTRGEPRESVIYFRCWYKFYFILNQYFI